MLSMPGALPTPMNPIAPPPTASTPTMFNRLKSFSLFGGRRGSRGKKGRKPTRKASRKPKRKMSRKMRKMMRR